MQLSSNETQVCERLSLLLLTDGPSDKPLVRPWWMEMDIIVLGTVGCASVVFLLSAIIICYKAIKRLVVVFFFFSFSRRCSLLNLTLAKRRRIEIGSVTAGLRSTYQAGNLTQGTLNYLSHLCCLEAAVTLSSPCRVTPRSEVRRWDGL